MAQVKAGRFREDLYYRLNVFPIQLPPLRERKGDVLLLAERFLRRMCVRYRKNIEGFSPAARLLLERHSWPGNVRELENLVERMALLCQGNLIETDLLPAEITRPLASQIATPREEVKPVVSAKASGNQPPVDAAAPVAAESLNMDDLEKQAILQALERARGNVREAARQLGLGHATVYRRIKRYGISLDDQGRLPTLDQPG
jgi:DNA-binding NtrC family response regulator